MNEIEIIVDGKIYRLTNKNNGTKYDRAKKDAGPNATQKQILAHYHKLRGGIQDERGDKVENGQFWETEEMRIAEDLRQLKHKTREELKEIMRNSIDNKNIPSSIYHKAKQELEFKDTEDTNKEHVAVKITESAKNNVFINSQIHGQLSLKGQGNKFTNTKVGTHSTTKKSWHEKPFGKILIGLVVLIIGAGIITLLGWN